MNRITKILTTTGLAVSLTFPALAVDTNTTTPKSATDASTTSAKLKYTNDQIQKFLKTFGFMVSQRSGLSTLNLTDNEWNSILAGMKMQTPPVDMQSDWTDAQEYLVHRSQEMIQEKIQEQQKAATTFFAKLDKNSNTKKTASGLYYEIIAAGEATKPTANDIVKVNYKGSFIDGGVFDDSQKNGGPVEFPLNAVIPGFGEGLQLVGKGGKIKLYVPANLGYGDQERPGIPAGSTLIFEAEVIDFHPNVETPILPLLPESTVAPANTSGTSLNPAIQPIPATKNVLPTSTK